MYEFTYSYTTVYKVCQSLLLLSPLLQSHSLFPFFLQLAASFTVSQTPPLLTQSLALLYSESCPVCSGYSDSAGICSTQSGIAVFWPVSPSLRPLSGSLLHFITSCKVPSLHSQFTENRMYIYRIRSGIRRSYGG